MVRSLIGGIVLIPCVVLLGRLNSPEKHMQKEKVKAGILNDRASKADERKTLLKGGICCGILFSLATNIQQIGIQYTTVGRAGFITACYIVIVPILGMVFFHKKSRALIWGAVALALIGLYLLCMTDAFGIGKGDILVLICSVLFSLHILVIDHFAPKTDGVKMSCIQFFVAGVLSLIPMMFLETTTADGIVKSWIPLLYAGVLSSGVAYTLQIIGQKNMNPTIASLILSLESCISVLAGWVILGEQLSVRESMGCVLMFVAIILAQIPGPSSEIAQKEAC